MCPGLRQKRKAVTPAIRKTDPWIFQLCRSNRAWCRRQSSTGWRVWNSRRWASVKTASSRKSKGAGTCVSSWGRGSRFGSSMSLWRKVHRRARALSLRVGRKRAAALATPRVSYSRNRWSCSTSILYLAEKNTSWLRRCSPLTAQSNLKTLGST